MMFYYPTTTARLRPLLLLFCTLTASELLLENFENPSIAYRPRFFYWFPDASVTGQALREDINSIAAVGGGGVTVVPHYIFGLPIDGIEPPTDWSKYGYGTPAFNDIFREILQAGQDNEMQIDFGLGASQGQGIPAPVESVGLAVQLLAGNVTIQPGQSFNGRVPPPSELPAEVSLGEAYQHEMETFGTPNLTATIAVQVIDRQLNGGEPVYHVDEDSIVDLSDRVEGGELSWTAPEGDFEWHLLTFWEGYSNQRSIKGGMNATNFLGNGSWVVDHFSRAGAQLMTNFVDEHILDDKEIQRLVKSLKSRGFEDSIELLSSMWWTPGLLDKFESAKGYSLVKYLPLIFVAHNQFRQAYSTYHEEYVYGPYSAQNVSLYNLDYLDVLTSLYGEYLQEFADWSHGVGMGYSAQTAYNIPLDMSASVPHVDLPQTESLAFLDVVDNYREFTGPAHASGARIISTELGATFVTYTQMLSSLVWQAKRSWAAGINDIVIHGVQYSGNYVGTTWPDFQGLFLMATENWGRLQPAWEHFSDITNFFARNNMVLQQGVSKVDLAFYLHKPVFIQGRENYDLSLLLEKGYTHEYIGPRNFDLPLMGASNDIFAPEGPGYKALVFYDQTGISSAAALRLLSLAENGLPIFIVGEPPQNAISGAEGEQSKVSQLMSDILGNNYDNVHQLDTLEDLLEALEGDKIRPRVELDCAGNRIITTWRSDPGSGNEYVYIYNDNSRAVSCSFSIQSMFSDPAAYVLDAWTGNMSLLMSSAKQEASILKATLEMAANETMLLALVEQNILLPDIEIKSGPYMSTASMEGSNIRVSAAFSHPGEVRIGDTLISHDANVTPSLALKEWDLTISAWHGPSPDDEDATEVRTRVTEYHFNSTQLVRWPEIDGDLSHVSGIGTYRANFTCPEALLLAAEGGRPGALLSSPPIEHTLRVFINDQRLPALDFVNPVADLTPHLRCGADDGDTNKLVVTISTPLLNAVKHELDTATFMDMTLEMMDEGYHNLEWMQHGLLGPVDIEWVIWKEAVVAGVSATSGSVSILHNLAKTLMNKVLCTPLLVVTIMMLWW